MKPEETIVNVNVPCPVDHDLLEDPCIFCNSGIINFKMTLSDFFEFVHKRSVNHDYRCSTTTVCVCS